MLSSNIEKSKCHVSDLYRTRARDALQLPDPPPPSPSTPTAFISVQWLGLVQHLGQRRVRFSIC